jgi:RHH-type proline utilization regulon transcriptional repressor/proline dehydrogenase/delta 1-pyrroline-5-carboxylate dehydrogenase
MPTNDHHNNISDLPEKAVKLAAEILRASRARETAEERSRSAMMARMMEDDAGKKFTIAMADQVLRMKRPARAAKRMASLIKEYGVPRYFKGIDRMALSLGNTAASLVPATVMPIVKSKVRKDSQHVIISAEEQDFAKYLSHRKQQHVRVNFNQLGEAVLGDQEADRRLHDNQRRLLEPGVDYISIKLSSIVSQISLTGYRQTLETIKPRLRTIYRAAIQGGGPTGPKFVNLDMEEYRDLHLTVDVFRELLDEPEFEKLEAGIVLQAYLPDSFLVLQSLTQWARTRKDRTGAGIKIRLVKGANLAMETVEASLEDWPQATFHTKLEVDANYKRMLEFAARPENAQAVRIGVGSHNLFDVAYALLLRERRGVEHRIEFEMLEGMANAQALEVRERSGSLIVYAPVVLDAEFEAAVAYLVRRLDENTEPGSFLGALFALREGTSEWNAQRTAFLESCRLARDPSLIAHPQRTQNRLTEDPQPRSGSCPFENIPNTDFSLPVNRQWAEKIIDAWKDKTLEPIPIQVGGQFSAEKLTGIGSDPSRPGHPAYRFAQADAEDIEHAISVAVAAKPAWSGKSIAERATILRQVAAEFARARGDSIGAMLLDAGKNIKQADVEISEAIDFANYYALGLDDQGWCDGTVQQPLGVVVVTPPWNFPYAIPAGGVLAALMAGNTVILKPARESVLTAWMLAQQCWNAGVPREVLQFAPTVDGQTGKRLISDARVDAVILTGSIFTAQLFQSWRPRLRLYAETSGKNSMIVSAAADLDLAVKDLVQGAFGHAGQKCSATSLALVQAEVYDGPLFMGKLKDAAESLTLGGSWNPSAQVTPVIRKPDETLERGLTKLESGESWLLEPRMIDNNPCHWSPGIRLGVKPGSWYHVNECFGPVLGLIRVDSFEEAIKIQNSSEFGLTGGLHSLDPEEVEIWREKVQVGNAYVNRSTTGAIVRRQPFGGWKDSCVGPGPKAGGPNYVATFCAWKESELPRLREKPSAPIASLVKELSALLDNNAANKIRASAESYAYWWNREFSREHDPSNLHGETNHFRYRPRPWHLIRLQSPESADAGQIFQLTIACATVGTNLKISLPAGVSWGDLLARVAGVEVVVESESKLVERLKQLKGGTLRIVGEFDEHQFAPAEIGNIPIIDACVLANGRIELLNYLKEQSVSETVHRYGNIV